MTTKRKITVLVPMGLAVVASAVVAAAARGARRDIPRAA